MNEETKVMESGSEKNPASKKEKKASNIGMMGAVAGGVVVGNLAWGLGNEAKERIDEYLAAREVENSETEDSSEEAALAEDSAETAGADATAQSSSVPVSEEAPELMAEIEDLTNSLPDNGIDAAPYCDDVTDEMSFSEAFATARADVGPGGVFEWHGKLYGTHYKEEWESMSGDQKSEYWASVEAADIQIEPEYLPEDYNEDTGGDIYAVSADTDGDGYAESVLIDSNEDGLVDVVVADLNHDGKIDAIIADNNFDGVADELIVDEDGDGIADIHEVDESALLANGDSDDSSIDSDFDNNADVSDWV